MPADEPNAPQPPLWRRYQRPSKKVSESPESGEQSPQPAAAPNVADPERLRTDPSELLAYARDHRRKIALITVGVLGVVGAVLAIVIPAVTRPDMFSDEGIQELADELEEEYGSTLVYDLVIYEDYVVVSVPAKPNDPDSTRAHRYYWSGGGLGDEDKTTTDEQAFDLRDLDGDVIGAAVREARAELIDDPETPYAIVEVPDEPDGYWIAAYVSNEYGEGGYLGVDLEGDEVTRTTW